MAVLIWVVEGSWPACVDAAGRLGWSGDRVMLIYVREAEVTAAVAGAYAGLFGRGRPARDPSQRLTEASISVAEELLDAAEARLGRPAQRLIRTGRVEREVVAAATGVDMLIVARDGDLSRLGPRSLGRHTRFVVDHAPCPVLLVWPRIAPSVESIPPPLDRPPGQRKPGRR
ncbi:MAG TPA: universal stress protein [Pseudonocardiaceae bacterium]|nr:universal stress protein [Pseudonocardiaceae bacterium]